MDQHALARQPWSPRCREPTGSRTISQADLLAEIDVADRALIDPQALLADRWLANEYLKAVEAIEATFPSGSKLVPCAVAA